MQQRVGDRAPTRQSIYARIVNWPLAGAHARQCLSLLIGYSAHSSFQIPSENQYNALITSPEYPPTFSEGYLGVTTVPVYMRIKEHHFLSPDTPVPCSSGLANGYFPPAMQYSSSADGVTVMADGRQYEYLTQGPARVHNSDSCDWCKRREEELSRIRSIRAMEGYDALFERAGLGSAGLRASYGGDSDESEGEGEDFPEHDPAKVLECDGIQDVIFTGAVSFFVILVASFVELNLDPRRRTRDTVKRGIILSITVG